MLKVGYVGLGAMGSSLSKHLTANFDLTVFDRNPAAVAAMVAQGAKPAASGAELARSCDIVMLCLPRTSDVKDALFGQNGLADALVAGKLVIDQTSGIPRETAAIAEDLAARGIAMIDAPVSGGIPAAQSRKVTVISSGSDAAWATAEPVLHAMTESVFRCSNRVGDGQALKLVNNAIGAGYRMATLELVALGRKMGLSLSSLVKTLNEGQGANFTTRHMLVGLLEGRSTTNFALALMIKDLDAALSLGAATVSPMPLTSGARGLMMMGYNLFGKNSVLDDVIVLTEKLSDVKYKADDGASHGLLVEKDVADFLALLDCATSVCNAMAVCECVAMGHKFGLSMLEMARILNVGSAWSKTSEIMLPVLASRSVPRLGITVSVARTAIATVVERAALLGVPLTLPSAVLTRLNSLDHMTEYPDQDFGMIAKTFAGMRDVLGS